MNAAEHNIKQFKKFSPSYIKTKSKTAFCTRCKLYIHKDMMDCQPCSASDPQYSQLHQFKENIMKNKNMLPDFDQYILAHDDYYEAKGEFLKDLNRLLRTKYGDKEGVVCASVITDIKELLEKSKP